MEIYLTRNGEIGNSSRRKTKLLSKTEKKKFNKPNNVMLAF